MHVRIPLLAAFLNKGYRVPGHIAENIIKYAGSYPSSKGMIELLKQQINNHNQDTTTQEGTCHKDIVLPVWEHAMNVDELEMFGQDDQHNGLIGDNTANNSIRNVTFTYQKTTQLHTFVQNNDIISVEEYLNNLDPIKHISRVYYMRSQEGYTAFDIAVISNSLDVLNFLLKKVKTPSDILNNAIAWGKTNEGTRTEKSTFADPTVIKVLEKFKQKHHLIEDKRTYTGEKLFKSKGHGKDSRKKSDLIKHMSIHTGKKSFKCEQCGREFARKDILTGHMKTHTGEKSFECKQCGKRLASKNALDYHTKTHTRSHNGINLWI